MKKYTKPMIVFESFTLSTNIAGDCGATAQNFASFYETNCGIVWNTENWDGSFVTEYLFATGYAGCNKVVTPDDGIHNTYCYDNPSDDTRVFNS